MKEDDMNNRWIDDRLAARLPDHDWHPDESRGFARFLEQRNEKRQGGRRWLWIGVAAVATSLSLAAFPVTRAFAERCVSVCTSVFSIGGAAPSKSFVKTGDRRVAPDFTLSDASGQPVKLSDFRGKVVLLNFWATWCVPCKAEIPMFTELQQSYGNRDFAILGISMDEDGWDSVRPYIAEQRMNYRVMIGNPDIAQLYGGLESVPTSFIIDKSGRIAVTHVGLCSKSEYEADIQAVFSE